MTTARKPNFRKHLKNYKRSGRMFGATFSTDCARERADARQEEAYQLEAKAIADAVHSAAEEERITAVMCKILDQCNSGWYLTADIATAPPFWIPEIKRRQEKGATKGRLKK